MNNYQDKLETVKKYTLDPKYSKYPVASIRPVLRYCLERLQELVDKETPKKPTEADASEQNSYCAWLCPTCGRTHINNYPLNYCSDCGQKIDWSDYEKYLREGEQEEN